MKDFTRGLFVGLLAGLGFACVVATAADLPKDLVGYSLNELGQPVFLTTYQNTKDGVKPGAHCPEHWHVVASLRPKNPEGDLFGCYAFTAAAEITVHWNNGKTIQYDSKIVHLADWFLKLYPDHAIGQEPDDADDSPNTGTIHHRPDDTIL